MFVRLFALILHCSLRKNSVQSWHRYDLLFKSSHKDIKNMLRVLEIGAMQAISQVEWREGEQPPHGGCIRSWWRMELIIRWGLRCVMKAVGLWLGHGHMRTTGLAGISACWGTAYSGHSHATCAKEMSSHHLETCPVFRFWPCSLPLWFSRIGRKSRNGCFS